MNVLVDTPVWSYAFRSGNREFSMYTDTLKSLIMQQRVLIIGVIRQEILSGYSDLKKFDMLKQQLSAFDNAAIIDNE